jgi:dipeptidyl aminopeptidase/acylaminoacyl peptidase
MSLAAVVSSEFLVNALWVVVALILIVSVFSARLIVRPGRAHVWSTPKELDLGYEDITFKAQDGVNLAGWFIPAPPLVSQPAPLIMVIHGWPWCRMGTQAKSLLNDLPGSRPVHLLPFMKRLHDAGYHVLAVDQRNFGDSESRGVVTGGWLESRDLLGALDYVKGRADVEMKRIGVIGFSQGGAALMFAAPQTDYIKAAIAIQPTTPAVFQKNYARALMGPLALIVSPLSELLYRIAGGPALSSIAPALVVRGARMPILFIQGTGDRWGTQADVAHMAAMAPHGSVIYPETTHRFEGYTWILEHPEVCMDFFRSHLASPTQSEKPRASA